MATEEEKKKKKNEEERADLLSEDQDRWNGPEKRREMEGKNEGGGGGERLSKLVWRWIIMGAAASPSSSSRHCIASSVCVCVAEQHNPPASTQYGPNASGWQLCACLHVMLSMQ